MHINISVYCLFFEIRRSDLGIYYIISIIGLYHTHIHYDGACMCTYISESLTLQKVKRIRYTMNGVYMKYIIL